MFLTRCTVFFLFFMTLSTFASTPEHIEPVIILVKYSRHPVRGTEGQPLTLKCTAEYEKERCGSISVCWCLWVSEKPCQNLTDPDRYLIQDNAEPAFRQKDVSVTFKRLTLNDTGLYQCKAICSNTGTTAMGHIINVTVTGHETTTSSDGEQKSVNHSDRCRVDLFLLNFIVLMLH